MNTNTKQVYNVMTPSMTSQIETLKEVGAILAQNLTDAKFKQEFDIKMEQATSTKEIHLLYKQILAKQALRKKIKDHPLLVNMPMSYHKCSLEFILTQVPELEQAREAREEVKKVQVDGFGKL